MNANTSSSLLVLGGPGVGKTVYGSQVLARLRRARTELALRGPPANIAPFELALSRLAKGLAPEHTGAATYHELVLPLEGPEGLPIDLVWPDYGGEQIRDIVELRRIPSAWQPRVQGASGWILFVRLDRVRRLDDVVTRPPEILRPRPGMAPPHDAAPGYNLNESLSWSDAAKLIELLQVLLYIRRTGFVNRVRCPPLTILLSCWDELPGTPLRPADELRHQLPLLAQFVESIWDAGCVDIVGLSAQGRMLSRDRVDEEYVDQGPEQFGYVVFGDGRRVADLTVPIAKILRRARSAERAETAAWTC